MLAEQDAPTVIRVGSHFGVAKILASEGEKGLSFTALAQKLETLPKYDEALATGKAGTVYLCHPFIVHAAQDHHGSNPKFMAQPPLLTKRDFDIRRAETELCPVEKAIVTGLNQPNELTQASYCRMRKQPNHFIHGYIQKNSPTQTK